MDQSSQVLRAELLSAHSDDSFFSLADDQELSDGSYVNMHDHSLLNSFKTASSQASDKTLSRGDDRGGKTNQTVEVADVIRRWTHALQRIPKQSLLLAKGNDGDGPDILRTTNDGGTSEHVESSAATLYAHQQHLASFQGSGRIMVGVSTDVTELTSTMFNVMLERVSASPTLQLPQLFPPLLLLAKEEMHRSDRQWALRSNASFCC